MIQSSGAQTLTLPRHDSTGNQGFNFVKGLLGLPSTSTDSTCASTKSPLLTLHTRTLRRRHTKCSPDLDPFHFQSRGQLHDDCPANATGAILKHKGLVHCANCLS